MRALCSSGISRVEGYLSEDVLEGVDHTDNDVLHEEDYFEGDRKRRRMEDEETELFGTPGGLETDVHVPSIQKIT